ncbi:hypothetical protein COBT_004076 [Conglomerata obtusa]
MQQNDEINDFGIKHQQKLKLAYALKVFENLNALLEQHCKETINENPHITLSQIKKNPTHINLIQNKLYNDYRNKVLDEETSEIKKDENVFRKNVYNIINEEFETYKLHMSSNGEGNDLQVDKDNYDGMYLYTHTATRLLKLCLDTNFNGL